jgi:hypothetical protein
MGGDILPLPNGTLTLSLAGLRAGQFPFGLARRAAFGGASMTRINDKKSAEDLHAERLGRDGTATRNGVPERFPLRHRWTDGV